MRGFSPLLFRLYASDLSDAIYALSRERQMGSQAALREALGRNDIEVRFGDGKQYVTMDGKTVELSAEASAQEVAQALNVTPLPAVQIASAPSSPSVAAPVVASKPIPAAGGFTPGSLKTLLQGIRTRQQTVMGGAVEKAKALNAALDQVDNMSNSMQATTDSILSEIGQFSNMPPEGEQ